MKHHRGLTRAAKCVTAMVLLATAGGATRVGAQELADFDYENLSFRGFGIEWSYLFPSQVESTQAFGVRADLGYLGPGLRIVPHITYWSSELQDDEVAELERAVEGFIDSQTPGGTTVDLGTIDWSDLALGLDGHVVWSIPYGLLGYAGAGAAAHFLNGGGESIDGTFVEDLLDSVRAGFNLHTGLEYPFDQGFRLYGGIGYEIMDDLSWFGLKIGGQIMTGPAAPGERALRGGGGG